VNRTGALIFCAEIIQKIENTQNLDKTLEKYLSENQYKKLGVFIEQLDKNALFSICKKTINKITILDKLPNFGYWKQTNNWLTTIKFEGGLYLAKIVNYSDQEFWAKMDDQIPMADMSRGIINLKLGRSLLNLTSHKNVWDNFAGQGRILIAGMDILEKSFASDIDSVVIPQLQKNYEWATKYWGFNKMDKAQNTVTATLQKAWTMDTTVINNVETLPILESESENQTKIAIVTEGFLGKNFKNPPEHETALWESEKIDQLWKKALLNIEKLPIPEIVGCLPFYPRMNFIPNYTFLNNPNWEIQALSKTGFIEYKRSNSIVGHLIFKLIRK
jgi:tRNA G10  N-methylase Trm11